MALFAEITLRPREGKTEISVQMDDVVNGLHSELWRRTSISDYSPNIPGTLSEPWLYMVLGPWLERFADDVIIVQGDELADEAAGQGTQDPPTIPGA